MHVPFGFVAAYTERGLALDVADVNLEREVLVKTDVWWRKSRGLTVSRSSRVGAAKAVAERARTKRVVKETIVAVDDASIFLRKTGGLYICFPGSLSIHAQLWDV